MSSLRYVCCWPVSTVCGSAALFPELEYKPTSRGHCESDADDSKRTLNFPNAPRPAAFSDERMSSALTARKHRATRLDDPYRRLCAPLHGSGAAPSVPRRMHRRCLVGNNAEQMRHLVQPFAIFVGQIATRADNLRD